MEKLQLMMFEAIGYKLKFSQKVTERYLDVLGVRFGKNSEMEQLMKTFISDRSTQEEIISNSRHKAYNEFRLLAKMQLKYDIEKLQKQIAEQASSPFLIGYQAACGIPDASRHLGFGYRNGKQPPQNDLRRRLPDNMHCSPHNDLF